jgi:hypothetical protein
LSAITFTVWGIVLAEYQRESVDKNGFNEADQWLLNHGSKVDDVLAIVFLGRSGSVFLGSLLDDHPQVLMLPGTQLSFYYYFWEKYGHLTEKNRLIDTFCSYFAVFFDVYAFSALSPGEQPAIGLGFSEMGEDRSEKLEIDKGKFIRAMRRTLVELPHIDRKVFFQAIHTAYAVASGRSLQLDRSKPLRIVYQLHMNWPDLVSKLVSDFPKAKMIHMIREPFQTMGSHFMHTKGDCHIMNKFYEDAFFYGGKERSKGVKLEDLHTKPRETLEKIIQWIGIDWSDSLLQSTFNGKKWWNLKDTEQVNGFNKVIISKDHGNLYFKFDRYRLKVLYSKRFKLWGYSVKQMSRLESLLLLPFLFIPFKMEILYYRNDSSGGLVCLKNIICDWLLPWRRRAYLMRAWKYALSGEIREFPLL